MHNKQVVRQIKGIDETLNNYTEINEWRQDKIVRVMTDHQKLNELHDSIIENTVKVAMKKVQSELGNPPAPFAFFLMGSAGRFEQSVLSDQDHGIIYQSHDESCQSYFLTLGAEITNGLSETGYELCDGQVMASNPLWCKSIRQWEEQIVDWMEDSSWKSLRHFSTFFDSRVMFGETSFLTEIKNYAFMILNEQPRLYKRLVENVDFVKKGIGVFGQLLPEQYGEESGAIKLKQTTFFPYVNALRLLALKENILEPSTLKRFEQLPVSLQSFQSYEKDFRRLLDFRLQHRKHAQSYKDVHLIQINSLNREEKQTLKQLMKKGYKLFDETKTIIEKECSTW
ncbi:DUF294 nucleotidyltransferase-like domain-containing protein [Aquibacillus koreensis]|uniref:DUF294 nucleotidyltransferase-like domain-containing protein n=1 Tax=Aquibacillus koreensis TaxID=279446 RepID=A0A9X3WL06_9BACI|nr:DUF294 nucleotidyltransferase-like domain-containing protein [Aquibacillus koreensis]MCT2536127.1 DUF294 nucleotidyltransferase-like domain-containing protein [Aquibacillus koreensis]MDC3422052.1 DUF294 nucleotidyltransferase-like domain-containing protein [Aquibacillus koreensis]